MFLSNADLLFDHSVKCSISVCPPGGGKTPRHPVTLTSCPLKQKGQVSILDLDTSHDVKVKQ